MGVGGGQSGGVGPFGSSEVATGSAEWTPRLIGDGVVEVEVATGPVRRAVRLVAGGVGSTARRRWRWRPAWWKWTFRLIGGGVVGCVGDWEG
ncbi:hypothetical protein ACFV24_17075 [Nocardia fluminea]|uniref:hypothetical protein n=1 Tax=Nocardia fluminea TaxID=134984 RepID=UPI0036700E72